MVKSRSHFNVKTLTRLLETHHSCVYLRKCERHLALYPNALDDIKESVRVHLNRLVNKFDAELDAIVLGFRNINILTNVGVILHDSPHVHINIEAEFYLFRPEKGSILSGVVNKKGRDNIGCLVHNIFNASIPLDVDEQMGVSNIEDISIGEPLVFQVAMVDFSGSLPYIQGTLCDSQDDSSKKSVSKKRKKSIEHEVRKKIKCEVTNPLSPEENFPGDFNTEVSTKLPTSILKKNHVRDTSSPARRISFYADKPETSDYTADEDKLRNKKKKKQDREDHQKKKTNKEKLDGDQYEFNEDSQNPENNAYDVVKTKKKKKKERMLQREGECEVTDGSESWNNIQNIDEILGKKKKLSNLSKNEQFEGIKTYHKDDDKNELCQLPMKEKKKKKKNIAYDQNREEASIEEQYGLEAFRNNENLVKDFTSEVDNKIFEFSKGSDDLAIEFNKEEKKKNKKKERNEIIEQPINAVVPDHQKSADNPGENEPKKKKKSKKEKNETFHSTKTKKGKMNQDSPSAKIAIEKNERGSFSQKDGTLSKSSKIKDIVNSTLQTCTSPLKEKESQLSSSKDSFESLSPIRNKNELQRDENLGFHTSQKKTHPNKKKVSSSVKTASDDTYQSFSPIKNYDDLESDENVGFVTSTQKIRPDKQKVSSGVQETNNYSFQSVSPIRNQDLESNDFSQFVTSTQIDIPPKKKKVSSNVQKTERSSKSVKRKSETSSDTDGGGSSSSSTDVEDFTHNEAIAFGEKMSKQKVDVENHSAMVEPAGSDFSSSDTDEHSVQDRLPGSYRKTKEVLSSKKVVSKSVQTDESGSELDTLPMLGNKKQLLSSNEHRVSSVYTEHNDSTDSDLPSHMVAQKALFSIPGGANERENQLNKKTKKKNQKTNTLSGEPLGSDLQISNSVVSEKKVKHSMETKDSSAEEKYSDGRTSGHDLGNWPLPKSLVRKRKSSARKEHPKVKPIQPASLPGPDLSSSESDIPSNIHNKISLPNKAKSSSGVLKHTKNQSESKKKEQESNEKLDPTKNSLPTSFKVLGSNSSSSDSELHSDAHNNTPPVAQEKAPSVRKKTKHLAKSAVKNRRENSEDGVMGLNVIKEKPMEIPCSASLKSPGSESSSIDSDLPSNYHNKAPLQKKVTNQAKSHSKSEVKNVTERDSDHGIDMQSTAVKRKFIKNPHKSPDSESSGSNSDPPSKVPDKVSPKKKKNKLASELKQTKHVIDKRKISESETDSVVQRLLQNVKSEILDSNRNSKHINVKETNKENSKLIDGTTSVKQTSGTKEKKFGVSKETVNNEKTNKLKASGKKYNVENVEDLSSLADELLKNL